MGVTRLFRKGHRIQVSATGTTLYHRCVHRENLERKGYVKSKHIGNTYQYTPSIRENEYKRHFMSGVVRNYFENSYKEMVSFFAKDQKISTDDLKDIIELIEKGKEK